MMTTEQRERLLGQMVLGVPMDIAMESLDISSIDLHFATYSDEALYWTLEMVKAMRTEFERSLFEELDSK